MKIGYYMKIGDYVVYLKNGDLSKLGQNKKDIWKITEISHNDNYGQLVEVELESLSSGARSFMTTIDNIVKMSDIDIDPSWFNEKAYNEYRKIKIVEDDKIMKNNMVKRTMDSNVDAAKVAAMITTGRAVNGVVVKQLSDRKVLPMLARGYADTPLGAVVIANIFDFAVKQFAADNKKFAYVGEAMMQAAMVDLLDEFDFEAIINDILSNVSLGDIAEES